MRSSSGINKTNARRKRKAKSICLPFASEASYPSCMEDRVQCRSYIMEQDRLQPELFPQALREGCTFHGFLHSKKPALPMRRIKLRTNGEQYQIRPSFMMPYMIGRIEEVEKALYYRRWGVPFDALAYGLVAIPCLGIEPMSLWDVPPWWARPSKILIDFPRMCWPMKSLAVVKGTRPTFPPW